MYMAVERSTVFHIETGNFRVLSGISQERVIEGNCVFSTVVVPTCLRKKFAPTNFDHVVDTILEYEGALGLILHDDKRGRLIIARDVYGRQSLLFSTLTNGFLLSAFAQEPLDVNEWIDVPPGSLTIIPLKGSKQVQYYTTLPPDGLPDELVFAQSAWIRTIGVNVEVVKRPETKASVLKVNRDPMSGDFVFPSLLIKHLRDSMMACLEAGIESISICFSGGVDSLLMAYITDMVTEREVKIDLIAVAFGLSIQECSQAPDRLRALCAYEELKRLRPLRQWNLICANVTPGEVEENRPRVLEAIRPCKTVLDESLGSVLWFALRGTGVDATGNFAQTSARYFVIGSGADELCAGYSRHRHRFEKDGLNGLADEIESELIRYGARNGARDARVAMDHDRIVIAPFLEGNTAAFCNRCPLGAKCDLTKPRGVGEKAIIRDALKALGSSMFFSPKQAMQFGSRFAKLTNSGKDVKGSDLAPGLKPVSVDSGDF